MPIIDELKHVRQALHQIPELSKDLPKTIAYIKAYIASFPCTILHPSEASVCAYFDFGCNDSIAYRSDMDALPIEEANHIPYRSQHAGCMHACGHDGHMAILLVFAKYLANIKHCEHNVLLIFQPAEETTGGAQEICQSGILETYHVSKVFGLHLWPELPAGQIATRKDECMARSSEVTISIQGKSSHCAKAEEGHDALFAGVQFIERAYQMEQSLPPSIHRLLKFGMMRSGTVLNAISASTSIKGSLRVFQMDVFHHMEQQLQAIAQQLEVESGCTFDISYSNGYPPLWNDAQLVEQIQTVYPITLLEKPSLLSEDFAFYAEAVPSVFLYVGTGNTTPLHADTFDFDEGILVAGVNLYTSLLALPS